MDYAIEISHMIILNTLNSRAIFTNIYFKYLFSSCSCYFKQESKFIFAETKQDKQIQKCIHFTCVMSNPETF